ncbi:FAD-binding domain-containing protein [Gigaspora margarita]|uniref:D-arabinono-1,4-lactone oxidase n=1 Tax=Gigaspora margarita TaxID=4874 RepID=A0A8H4EVF7_GIGMA|nr:FAD-binding domain-containing protein [Gigaspora margarita]
MKHILSYSLILLISIVAAVTIDKDLVIRSAKPIKNKTWENWNGEIHISPNAIFEPSTLEDLLDIVKLAKKNNKKIRCAAQGHTESSLSVTENYLVVVTNLNKIKVKKHPIYGWTVTAEAGISLSDLDETLRNHDPPLTLDSEILYNTVRVSGVVAVGAHGDKTNSGIMSDQLCSMKIVTSFGEVCEFSEEINKSEFNAAKVNLGLFGIIYSLTFRVQPMYNLRMTDIFIPANEWLNNPYNIKNLLESSDGISIAYWPFNGFNLSDPNPLDSNRDRVGIKNWIRTDEPVNFTQQQLEQLHETQKHDVFQQYKLISSNLQNPDAIPNITATLFGSFGNASTVFQAPDAIHFVASEESAKFDFVEIGFKVDPDFSNVAAEFSYVIQTIYEFARKDPEILYCLMDFVSISGTPYYEEFTQLLAQRYFDKYKAKPHWGKKWEFIPKVESYLSDVLSNQIKQFEKVRAKYDPYKIFFDNKSLQDIFSRTLDS